ncbi:MAG TPA: NAD(P)H-hydrate dehydratase [Methylibium sp.]
MSPLQLVRVLPELAQRVPSLGAWPLHDAAATRELETRAAAALPSHVLMQRAGLAVARLAQAVAPHARRVWIAAGPGNNGGDGLEAAMHLHLAGREVSVSLAADGARLPADAAASLQRAKAAGVRITDAIEAPPPTPDALAIDALLGLGASRPPGGNIAQATDALNRGALPVLAIDLPSGLNASTGQAFEACVRARWTLSLLTLKPGLFTSAGRDHAGEVWFDSLGVAGNADAGCAWLPCRETLLGLGPRRAHSQHKGSFGDVWIVGGAPSMVGAALLAARASLYAGAGRVYLHLLDASAARFDPAQPELMLRDTLPDAAALPGCTVVCGCGGGEAVAAHLPGLLVRAGRLLLDADALNAVAADAALAQRLSQRAAHGLATLLTPHPLEAARLLKQGAADVQADRLAAARALAQRYQSVVVLKGSGSVICAPGAKPSVNPSGNAALASPGTGDVLAGWLGGLWSQGLSAHDAARLGTYQHGAAADGWLAERGAALALPAGALVQRLALLPQPTAT